jgi:hypothetical protein
MDDLFLTRRTIPAYSKKIGIHHALLFSVTPMYTTLNVGFVLSTTLMMRWIQLKGWDLEPIRLIQVVFIRKRQPFPDEH